MVFTSTLRVVSWPAQRSSPCALHIGDFGEAILQQSRDAPRRRPGPLARQEGPRLRPPKLYRIGEVVAYSGLSRQTIHNYTTMGLLREAGWTEGGHRLYEESAFQRLDEIADMKARGRSLQDIREHFASVDEAGK